MVACPIYVTARWWGQLRGALPRGTSTQVATPSILVGVRRATTRTSAPRHLSARSRRPPGSGSAPPKEFATVGAVGSPPRVGSPRSCRCRVSSRSSAIAPLSGGHRRGGVVRSRSARGSTTSAVARGRTIRRVLRPLGAIAGPVVGRRGLSGRRPGNVGHVGLSGGAVVCTLRRILVCDRLAVGGRRVGAAGVRHRHAGPRLDSRRRTRVGVRRRRLRPVRATSPRTCRTARRGRPRGPRSSRRPCRRRWRCPWRRRGCHRRRA